MCSPLLNAGNFSEQFFAIREDLVLFMQDSYTARFDEYITLFKDIEFLSELSVTTNITHHLYILNLICKNHFEIYSSLLGVSILYEQNQDRWKLT